MRLRRAILLGLVGSVFMFSASAARPAASGMVVVGAEKAVEKEDFEIRHYTGQVVSKSTVKIAARVSGEILEIGFHDGEVVREGQMLYRLDPVQYEAAVKGAQANIEKCKAELAYAQSNFDRINLLYKQEVSSLDALENSKATLGAAQAALLSAEAELIRAQDDLKNTVITAPHSGLVGVTALTPGNYVTPNSGTLLTVVQVQPIRVRFSINTADLLAMFGSYKELMENGSVEVRLPDGRIFDEKGEIELLNNEVNPRTDAIQVYASFPNRKRKLITGTTLSVKLFCKSGKRLPAISPSALMYDAEGSYVYVVDSAKKVEKRYVVPGNGTSELQLIREVLVPGETVITRGTHKVVPGMTVELSNGQ